MSDYVTRADATLGGKDLSDIKNFQYDDVEYAKQVELMNKSGNANKTPRFLFSVDYVRPTVGAIKFQSVENEIMIIGLEGGGSFTYTGVKCLTVGGATVDGEDEMVSTISFSATSMNEE